MIKRKKTIIVVATVLLLTISPFYERIFFTFQSSIQSTDNLSECCPVGGNLQGKEKTATAETVTMQHMIKFKLEQLSSY